MLNFVSTSNQCSLWNFTWTLQVCLNEIGEFIKFLHVHCMGMKESACQLLCNGGQKLPFFSFFFLLENSIEVNLVKMFDVFESHQKNVYDIWPQPWKFHQNLKNFYYINQISFVTLSSNWKVKIFTTFFINKSVSFRKLRSWTIFANNRFCSY